jgi:hypothetical protein
MNQEIDTLQEVNNVFKIPIFYNNKKRELNTTIINDLEMTETYDASCNPINSFFFNTKTNNKFSAIISNECAKYYTTDISYLTDMQQLLKTYTNIYKDKHNDIHYKNIIEIWNELKGNDSFKEKYHYVDWSRLEFLNSSEYFLQVMSMYNLLSPAISFITPVIIIILPFFIIKVKGIELDFTQYISILKIIIKQNALGKLFVDFEDVPSKDKVYIIVSALFYLFSIYQNILVCIRFNYNMIAIHKYITDIHSYLDYTINNMNNYLQYSSRLASQYIFNDNLHHNIIVLTEIKSKLESISEYKLTNFKKMGEIGKVMKYFYELHSNKTYNNAFLYSFGFNGYTDCIEGIIHNIQSKQMQFCKFKTKNNRKNIFKKSYYAPLKETNHIKNTIKLNKNMIITGPNASGKTTILKTTLLNIIYSQQFGCGFYRDATFKPYDYIHCYLNIPDTSGRDSLFQAEARRCKEIIDTVNSNKECNHFCVFDELYSGTNPEEAISSSTSFMKYLIKNKNVSCLLTTHFTTVCTNLENNTNIINYHMVSNKLNNTIHYTYTLKKGISHVKGGINVLYNMNYPKEIVDECK